MLPLKIRNSPFHRIGDSYGHLFNPDHFMGRSAFDDSWLTKPLANITRSIEGYQIRVRIPGFRKEEISVQIDDNLIKVIADKETEEEHEMVLEEVSQNHMERSFELSGAIDTEIISASLDKGILTIKLPFEEEKHVHKTIQVK